MQGEKRYDSLSLNWLEAFSVVVVLHASLVVAGLKQWLLITCFRSVYIVLGAQGARGKISLGYVIIHFFLKFSYSVIFIWGFVYFQTAVCLHFSNYLFIFCYLFIHFPNKQQRRHLSSFGYNRNPDDKFVYILISSVKNVFTCFEIQKIF